MSEFVPNEAVSTTSEASARPDDRPLALQAVGLGKAYRTFASPMQRLRAALFPRKMEGEAFWALKDVSLAIPRGEVLGIVGRNGAGKSTLLQLLCSTMSPTTGTVQVNGRISALLELGAGFNPEFSGRDNVMLNGPLLGLSREELVDRFDSIVEFSGIGRFIDQPVKTYSSGMFVRLAFSLAVSVDPDILVVDEALSVGDGEFSRKSFDRILALKARGTTILFCSHSLYQVEAFCSRVAWMHEGRLKAFGDPQRVIREYSLFLGAESGQAAAAPLAATLAPAPEAAGAESAAAPQVGGPLPAVTATPGYATITRVETSMDGIAGKQLRTVPGQGRMRVLVEFESDPALPAPTLGVGIDLGTLVMVSCTVARSDGVLLDRDEAGRGRASVEFDQLPVRKGDYLVSVYLATEDALHIYASVAGVATLHVEDPRPEPGLVDLPRRWDTAPGHLPAAT